MRIAEDHRGAVCLAIGAALLLLASAAPARTKLHVGAMTIDGQSVRELACEFDSGGLGAVLKVVGALSRQKPALDACAPGGAAFRVRWTWSAGQATAVTVLAASDDSGSACMRKVLQITRSANQGECQALVLVGKAAAAAKAADALSARPAR